MGKDKQKVKATAENRLDKHSGTGVDPNPKKGGAGGKYTWGKEGGAEEEMKMDKADPMYESPDEKEGAAEEKKEDEKFEAKKE